MTCSTPRLLEDVGRRGAASCSRASDRDDRIARRSTRELATVEQERSRLVAAIAAAGQLDGLLQALQAREARRAALEAQTRGDARRAASAEPLTRLACAMSC